MKNTVKFTTKNGIDIEAYLTADNYVRVKCAVAGEEYSENPYKIHKEPQNTELKDEDCFKIGSFYIEKNIEGYTLYDINRQPVYSSKIEISYDRDGRFVAIETEWDRVGLVQELWETRTYFGKYKFMGMGEACDTLTLNNSSYKFYHVADLGNQEKMYIPFYFTNSGYAVYYNANGNDEISFTDDENTSTVFYKTKQLYFDCYMYTENTPKQIVSRFYDFSGSRSLLPQWTFGYIQSKFGYQTEQEVYDLLKQADKHNMKMSAVVIDLHWYKRMGDLDWNEENFPNHEKLRAELKKRNIKLLTISQPFFTSGCKNYKYFDENDVFAKRTKEVTAPVTMVWGDWWCRDDLFGSVINPIAPNAEKIIGEKYTELKNKGMDGFWLDLGEPENVPPQTFFNNYSEEEFHLHFANEWIKIINTAVSKSHPDYRIFILSRCGYTGTAGYNVGIWSGDSSSTFTNLKKQILLGINSGISGYSYWGSDAGGFLSQLKLPDTEVYTRWMQFSCFSPMFRTHGKKTPREPWCCGGESEEICLNLVNLRYKLLPYIYSSAYQTYKDGTPIMRPMYMENCNDDKCWEINDQYYFGDNILVAPVLESIKDKATKKVYLPQGLWYDFNTLKPVNGGNIEVESVLNTIPVYLKEGTATILENELIVTQPTTEDGATNIWYVDDGETNDYLNGYCEVIKMSVTKNSLTITDVKEPKTINIKYVQTNGNIQTITEMFIDKGTTIINF